MLSDAVLPMKETLAITGANTALTTAAPKHVETDEPETLDDDALVRSWGSVIPFIKHKKLAAGNGRPRQARTHGRLLCRSCVPSMADSAALT